MGARSFVLSMMALCSSLGLLGQVVHAQQDGVKPSSIGVGDTLVLRRLNTMRSEIEFERYQLRATRVDGYWVTFERTTLSSTDPTFAVGRKATVAYNQSTGAYREARLTAGEPRSVQFPLVVGAKWQSAYTFSNSDGGSTKFDSEAEVKGTESISVAGRSLNAFRIVQTIGWQRHMPVGEATPNFSGTDLETMLYSTEIGFFVRRDIETRRLNSRVDNMIRIELVEFSKAK